MTHPLLRFSIALVAALMAPPAAAQDLSGVWRDERGGRYLVRQVEEHFCWSMAPTNVFCGIVVGKLIAGRWLDLPTGRFNGHGRMVLQVESPDRLVKVSQTASYGGSIWTREGSAPVSTTPSPQAPPSAPPPSPQPTTTPVENGGPISWDFREIDSRYLEPIGRRIQFVCPPDDNPPAFRGLYGNIDGYTGDSSVCKAAQHSGAITAAGGTVIVETRPGRSSYPEGGQRNGVYAGPWAGSWPISFVVISQASAADYQSDIGSQVSGGSGATVERNAGWEDRIPPEFRGKNGMRIRFTCPPAGKHAGYVWGSDIYTDDSMVCQAAVHAGLITFARGGTVTLEIRPGMSSYQSSSRNGITSGEYGAFGGSFVFVR